MNTFSTAALQQKGQLQHSSPPSLFLLELGCLQLHLHSSARPCPSWHQVPRLHIVVWTLKASSMPRALRQCPLIQKWHPGLDCMLQQPERKALSSLARGRPPLVQHFNGRCPPASIALFFDFFFSLTTVAGSSTPSASAPGRSAWAPAASASAVAAAAAASLLCFFCRWAGASVDGQCVVEFDAGSMIVLEAQQCQCMFVLESTIVAPRLCCKKAACQPPHQGHVFTLTPVLSQARPVASRAC